MFEKETFKVDEPLLTVNVDGAEVSCEYRGVPCVRYL